MNYFIIAALIVALLVIVYLARVFIWPWYVEYARLKEERANAATGRHLMLYEAETRRFGTLTITSGYGEYTRQTLVIPGEAMYPAPLGNMPRESIATHYAPHITITKTDAPAALQLSNGNQATAALERGKIDFLDCMEYIEPGKMILGLAPHPVCVGIGATLHGALAGATDRGKTSIARLLMLQYILLDAQVYLADPHYTPIDPKSGDDWRPLAARLAEPPARTYNDIEKLLKWIATDEMPRRYAARFDGQPFGPPMVLFVDELPAVIDNRPKVAEYMAALLREARKVDIYFVGAAQDMLVKTLGVSGGVRECFRTAFYVGGDATTARTILDLPAKTTLDEANLGKGLAMLRSAATPDATLVRIPFVSNETLYRLLGKPQEQTISERPTLRVLRPDQDEQPATATKETKDAAARRLWAEGYQSVRLLGTELEKLGYTGTSVQPVSELIKRLGLTKDSPEARIILAE